MYLGRNSSKAKKLKKSLDELHKDTLTNEQAEFIVNEASKNNFNDVLSSTDDKISYTGALITTSPGAGFYAFSSWGGSFKMQGAMCPAIAFAIFLYARMEIFKKYDFNTCNGYLSFRIAPVGIALSFSMDEKGQTVVGEGVAAGPAVAMGMGSGTFTIYKS